MHKLACAIAAVLATMLSGAQAADYTVRNLSQQYGSGTQWTLINNAGDLLGAQYRGIVRQQGDVRTVFAGSSETEFYFPSAFGNDGTAYFTLVESGDRSAHYRMTPDGGTALVPQLVPSTRSPTVIAAVNDHGVAVGTGATGKTTCTSWGCETYIDETRATIYANGTMRSIGTFGYDQEYATDINNRGIVVGRAEKGGRDMQAFVYNGTEMYSIASDATATAINDANQIVGTRYVSGIENYAFLYQNGVSTDLTVSGYGSTAALDINNAGQVLLSAESARGIDEFFLYYGGAMINLNTILAAEGYEGFTVAKANDINDLGQILVYVYGRVDGVNVSADLLLTPGEPPVLLPVPEPGTYAMLLAGLGLVGFAARRKRVSAA